MQLKPKGSTNSLALLVLAAFVITFAICRLMVYMIMSHDVPNLYVHVGETHVHHMNFGIFLLCSTGAYLLFCRPTGYMLYLSAAFYGIGLGLLFDEYGMCLNMGGGYWQKTSVCSVMIVGGLLSLIVAAPHLGRLRMHQWAGALVVILILTSVGRLLAGPIGRVEKKCMSRLIKIEKTSPR